jgi:gamma-glutamyltranspeptidase / glutathione hydrolase
MLRRIARWMKVLGAVVLVPSAGAADLSPVHWPVSERAELQQREFFDFPPYEGVVKGRTGLVAGTLSPVAVHAGLEALRRGGTAADAAATVAFTQIATDLGSVVSYAGVTNLLYYEAKSRKVYALDAGWGSYAHETDAGTIPTTDVSIITGQTPTAGASGGGALGRQTLVGGFMAGMEALHQRFGRLKFADLLQPAIWYAENGVPISPPMEAWFRSRQTQLWRTREGRRFASMSDGSLPKVGDLFRQPDLARTLKAVAQEGAAYMYTGDWARQFVDAIRAEGGRAELEDLARYKPAWREPLSVQFNGATVYGPGEDSTEACPVLETLNLLSALHIEELGPYWHDPAAFKDYAYALRFTQYAHELPQVTSFEASHGFKSDCKTRLSLQYAAAVAPALTSLLGSTTNASAQSGHHSDSVVVVDRWGNVAALVHSINALTWGDTGIVVGGIPIADSAAINKGMLMKLKPGEMVPDSMSPVIALKGGKPV